LLADIEQAYEEGLVDPRCIGIEDVERDLAMGKEHILARLADDPHLHLVEDTEEEMGWWSCFQHERPAWVKTAAEASPKAEPEPAAPQIKNTKPKTGRNEPCPCGSGKKYKKCCGA
jgi:preprotein translocase subunit SecA